MYIYNYSVYIIRYYLYIICLHDTFKKSFVVLYVCSMIHNSQKTKSSMDNDILIIYTLTHEYNNKTKQVIN
jgi:hypothetical protein